MIVIKNIKIICIIYIVRKGYCSAVNSAGRTKSVKGPRSGDRWSKI